MSSLSILGDLVARVESLEGEIAAMQAKLASSAPRASRPAPSGNGYRSGGLRRTDSRHTMARFETNCPSCGHTNAQGDRIFYVPKGCTDSSLPSGAYCATCKPEGSA